MRSGGLSRLVRHAVSSRSAGLVAVLATMLVAGASGPSLHAAVAATEEQRLTASDGAASDNFGLSVDIDGETAVVGAPFANTPTGPDTGAAYVFVRSGSTWTQQQKLIADDRAASDSFGHDVAVSGDTVVVGAPFDDTQGGADAGSAYVFVRSGSTWSQQQKLTSSDGLAYDLFGISVDIDGDTAVVGACSDDTPLGDDTGSAYAFTRSGTVWTEQQKMTASDGGPADLLGISAALDGDTALFGAYADNTPGGTDAGSAYVFTRSGTAWSQQQQLTATDGDDSDFFGISVDVDGDTAVAGAHTDNTAGGTDAGSAYVFTRSEAMWTQQEQLLPDDGAAEDMFGIAVAIEGDTAVVGANFDDREPAANAGSAYAFARSGEEWTQQHKIVPSDGMAGDRFSVSVALDGGSLAVGSYFDDAGATDSGSAYVFRFPGEPPQIASFDPSSAAVGRAVVLTGSGFEGATEVAFAGTPAPFTVVDDTEITATVPNGALTGTITVTTPAGTAESPTPFRVRPKVKRFSPASGSPGTAVVVTGSAFTGATRVRFDGVTAEFTVDSYSRITASVPAAATTGRITVVTPGGSGRSRADFVVT